MDIITQDQLIPIPQEWTEYYNEKGIDIHEVIEDEIYWYDNAVLSLFDKYGVKLFRKVSVWSVRWNLISSKLDSQVYKDPRSIYDKLVLFWLRTTQNKASNINIRRLDRLLKNKLKY